MAQKNLNTIQNPEDNLQLHLTINKAAIVQQIRDAANTPCKEKVAKDYINPEVAMLLNFANEQVKMQDGTIISKTEIEDLNRNAQITGARAREMLMLIFDRSDFYKNFSIVYGDELTIPMDIYGEIPEQLMSTKRIGRQLSNTEELDLINVIGSELFCRHVERQYDIPVELLRNFLYRPDFGNVIHGIIQQSIANDFLRLATNGYSDTYGISTGDTITSGHVRDNFYTLSIGHEKLLRTLNGAWTNSNGENIFTGKLGTHLTPNKVDVNVIRKLVPFEDDASADNTANYTESNLDLFNHSTSVYQVSPGDENGGYAELISPFRVIPKTEYKVTVHIGGEDSNSKGRLSIVTPDNIVLGHTQIVANVDTKCTFNFYTGDNAFVNVRLNATGWSSGKKRSDFKDIKIERYDTSFTPLDVLVIMDKLLSSHRKDYKNRDNVFVMSWEDYEAYQKARSMPYTIVNGEIVPTNTEYRDNITTSGDVPMYRGKRIIVNPYKCGLNEETPEAGVYGNIYYGPIKELQIGTQNKVEVSREYNARSRHGGSAIEHTECYYIDFGIRNKEAFSIAFGGAKCETPIFSSSNVGKGTKITTAVENAVVYPYSDTPGALIYQSTTEANLADYDTAVANATLIPRNTRLLSGTGVLADSTYYVRAFRPGLNQPSDTATIVISAS